MKGRVLMKFKLIIYLLVAVFIVGCSSSSNGPTLVELNVEPKISILDIGTSEYYQAIATYSNGDVADVSDRVSWSLENQSGIVESVEHPDYPGLSFALAVKAGEDNIVATLGGVSTKSAITVVDVQLVTLVVTPSDVDLSV